MTPEFWRKVKPILEKALALKSKERDAYVAQACQEDHDLFIAVQALLTQYDKGEPLLGPATLLEGDSVGKYMIVDRLAKGGMALLYKARDTELNRMVVLKMPAWVFATAKQRKRLLHEAKLLAALNHPNIVHVYGIEEVRQAHFCAQFIAMEYVPGQTLAAQIPRTGMRLEDALGLARQIVAALLEAHAKGIAHRDLKPANIMITESGLVKVLDFGMGAWPHPVRPPAEAPSNYLLAGTPDYMSPEQAAGERGDRRSDIFSFGSILYEMLAGTHPFAGRSPGETLTSIKLRAAPPLPRYVPEELQKLVFATLEKDPRDRLQSVVLLQQALSSVSLEKPQSEGRQPYAMPVRVEAQAHSAARLAIGAALAGVTLVALVALLRWLPFSAGAPRANPSPEATIPAVLIASPAPPAKYDARYDRAALLMQLEKWSEAKALFDEVIRSDPKNIQALYNRAVCLQNLMKWDQAVPDFSEVLRRQPKNTRALYNRAMCYMNLEKLKEALADLNGTIELNPSSRAYSNRAKVRAALGDKSGALEDQRRALELSR